MTGPPTVQVLLDDGSGTFPVDVSAKVMAMDGYEITRGRDDWQGAATAGELNLTLNNSDGRFTPGSTILGSPSPIQVDQRIRLKETVNGVTYTRYTGYVKSWPVSWPATVTTFSTVQLTATDAQARAERRPLRSMLEEEILLDSPAAYYTLGEAEGSTSAGDTSGNGYTHLTIAGAGTTPGFVSGAGPVDGLSALQMLGGKHLEATSPTAYIDYHTPWTMEATVTISAVPGVQAIVCQTYGRETVGGTYRSFQIGIDSTGHANMGVPGVVVATGAMIADGQPHHLAVTQDATQILFYVDGVQIVAATGGPFTAAPVFAASVGDDVLASIYDGGSPMTGFVSHFALYASALTSARISARAGIISGASESADARIARIAGYIGIPTGTLDASVTSVPAQATSGVSAQDALQEVADAEMGLVFINGSGNLTFHNRSRVTSKTTPDLILSSQFVTPDVQPVTDDQQIVNYVEATAAGTGGMSIVRDAASETTHGRYPVSQSYLVQTDEEAMSRGQWVVAKQAEPSARYGTLTINLYKMTAAQASATLAALDLDCWLQVTSMASQTPGGTTVDVVVQGWRAVTTAESWTITCNVVPFSLFQAAIWDDPNSLWDTAVWFV